MLAGGDPLNPCFFHEKLLKYVIVISMNTRNMGSKQSAVTIREVAREAGVAMSTVSYALNGKAVLSEATRTRVLQTAERLGYRRRSARQSSQEKAAIPLIAILLPGGPGEPPLDYHYLAETLRGATESAEDFGFLVTVLYEKVKNPQFDFAGLCHERLRFGPGDLRLAEQGAGEVRPPPESIEASLLLGDGVLRGGLVAQAPSRQSRCRPGPSRRACSIFVQRSITTVRPAACDHDSARNSSHP